MLKLQHMAMFINNTGKRSELQEKIAAELREKMAKASDDDNLISRSVKEAPDLVEDSEYIKSYKKSKPIPRPVIVLIVAGAIAIVCGLVIVLTTN